MTHILWSFDNLNQKKSLIQHDGRVMNQIHFKTTTGLLLVTDQGHVQELDGHFLQ